MRSPDKVFSRELLYELVWKNGYYGEQNAVNVHVSNIRKKLAAAEGRATTSKPCGASASSWHDAGLYAFLNLS